MVSPRKWRLRDECRNSRHGKCFWLVENFDSGALLRSGQSGRNFCSRFSHVNSQGNEWWHREMSDGFSGNYISQIDLFVRQVKDASFWLEQHLNGVLDETTVTRKDLHNYQQLYIPRETWTKSRSQLLALEKAKFIKIIKNVWKQTTCFSYHQRLKNKLEDLFWNKLYKGIATKLHIYLYDKFSTFVKYYNLLKRTTI